MFYFLLFIFSLCGYFILLKLPFVKKSGIPAGELAIYFLIRIISAIAVGWITLNFYPGGNDYWGLNEQGINEHHFLMNDPVGFFRDLFHSNYSDYSGIFGAVGTYWNDLKNILLGKFLAFCNILSQGNYYLNAMIWNVLGMLGSVGFYRGWVSIHPTSKAVARIAAFLIPSTIFFSSGIHKDLIIFFLLGIFFYCMIQLGEKRKGIKYLVFFLLFGLLIFLIRNYLAVILIPLAILYLISKRKLLNPLRVFGLGAMAGSLLLLTLHLAGPKFSVFRIMAERQEDFAELPPAGSDIQKPALSAKTGVFIQTLPSALKDGFLQPLIWKSPLSLLGFSIEWLVIWILFLTGVVKWKTGGSGPDPTLGIFSWMLCFCLFLITGYIVNNLGAIVRYRSIYLPLLVFPVLQQLNIHIKLKNIFIFKSKKQVF